MEHKYIVNVVYNQPYLDQPGPEGRMNVEIQTASFGFEKYKDAKKHYEKLSISRMLEFETIAGKISFPIISLEVLDVEKLSEFNKQRIEEENGRTESNAGARDSYESDERPFEYADYSESFSEDESNSKQEVFEQTNGTEQSQEGENSKASEATQ